VPGLGLHYPGWPLLKGNDGREERDGRKMEKVTRRRGKIEGGNKKCSSDDALSTVAFFCLLQGYEEKKKKKRKKKDKNAGGTEKYLRG